MEFMNRIFIVTIASACLLCGCSKNERETRRYTEKLAVAGAPQVTPPMAAPPVTQPVDHGHAAEKLVWQAPEGWQETTGSGMRLATLLPGIDGVECSIVALGASSGSLAMNVERWAGQLGFESSDYDLDAFLSGATIVTTAQHNHQGPVFDFTTLSSEPGADSMIAGVFPLHGKTVYVKLTGPVSDLKPLRETFLQLCRSLRMVADTSS